MGYGEMLHTDMWELRIKYCCLTCDPSLKIPDIEIRKKLWKKGAAPPKKTVFDKLEALERSEQHLVLAILWGVVIILGLYIVVKEASFANINLR